jgi:hypothetical protein
MNLYELIIAIVVVWFGFYLVETSRMSPPIRALFRIVVVAVAILWLMRIFGVAGPRVPRVPRV